MWDKYYLPGDQLTSFVCREGILSIVRVKEINNKKTLLRLDIIYPFLQKFEGHAIGAVWEDNQL